MTRAEGPVLQQAVLLIDGIDDGVIDVTEPYPGFKRSNAGMMHLDLDLEVLLHLG